MVLDFQKSCKDDRASPYTPHPVSPNVNILYLWDTFVKTKKLTLVQCYELNSKLYLDCANVLFLLQDPIQGTTLHLVFMSP